MCAHLPQEFKTKNGREGQMAICGCVYAYRDQGNKRRVYLKTNGLHLEEKKTHTNEEHRHLLKWVFCDQLKFSCSHHHVLII